VDTLTLPLPNQPFRVSDRQTYWLKLADIALADAQVKKDRLKEYTRLHVKKYKQITANKSVRKAA
jgi:hypothetical protein